MKNQQNLATRYAKALLELASETDQSMLIGTQLQQFRDLLEDNPELSNVFTHPVFDQAQRSQIVLKVLDKLEVHKTTQHFIRLLIDKKRAPLFPQIQETYQRLLDQQRQQLNIRVVSSSPLTDDYIKEIKQHFHNTTQQNILVNTEIDPSLIGGVKVWVGNAVYDGTIQSRLSQLKSHLLQQIS